jgi:hypothetical protein
VPGSGYIPSTVSDGPKQGFSLNVFAGRVFPAEGIDGRDPWVYATTSTSAIILMKRRGSTGLTRN